MISIDQWGAYEDGFGNAIDSMLPSEQYAIVKACDAGKKENARKESSIAITIIKQANLTVKPERSQRRSKGGRHHGKWPYGQKRPSREYLAKMKQEFGDKYVECGYCHWPGHTIEFC